MPRPFGTWHPATSIAELRARTPRWRDYNFIRWGKVNKENFYHPETMQHFVNPQAYRDHYDRLKTFKYTTKFFGDGVKESQYFNAKIFGAVSLVSMINVGLTWFFYNRWVPATSPTWRKFMNKEWEEAIDNSPWDHRSHVWAFSNVCSASLGSICSAGSKKFYIPT